MKTLQITLANILFSVLITLAIGRIYLDYYTLNFAPVKVIPFDLSASAQKLMELGYTDTEAADLIKLRIADYSEKGYVVLDKSAFVTVEEKDLLVITE